MQRPLYLTSILGSRPATAGHRRRCIDAAAKLVKQWPGDTIRLDAYDAVAGAVNSTGNAASAKWPGVVPKCPADLFENVVVKIHANV